MLYSTMSYVIGTVDAYSRPSKTLQFSCFYYKNCYHYRFHYLLWGLRSTVLVREPRRPNRYRISSAVGQNTQRFHELDSLKEKWAVIKVINLQFVQQLKIVLEDPIGISIIVCNHLKLSSSVVRNMPLH